MAPILSEKKASLDIVIRFSSLGDIVLCSAFVEKLKKTSSHTLVFATSESQSDIITSFEHTPDALWSYKGSSLDIFFKTFEQLKAHPPIDHLRVFDLHGVPKSFFLRAAAFLFCLSRGISYRLFKSPKKSFLRALSVYFKKDLLGERYIYQEHQRLIEPQNEFVLPHLKKRESSDSITQRILIAPDSQHWKKKWPVSHWEDFFTLAHKELPHAVFTLVGSSDAFPQDLLDQLRDNFGDRFKNRLGRLPLSDLSRIASEHRLTVCGNSAWQHISEAVDVPVISMPGPIIRGFGFSPFLKNSKELEVNLACRPCTRHGGGLCPQSGNNFHACMKNISPQLVLSQIKELLK